MSKTVYGTLTALALWTISAVLAQPPSSSPAGDGSPAPPRTQTFPGARTARGSRGIQIVAAQMLAQGDKDSDHQLSQSEFTALAEAWFDKMDADHSGKLTKDQLTSKLRTVLPAGPEARGSSDNGASGGGAPGGAPASISFDVLGPVFFSAADLDKDGVLTRAEFKEIFAKWFDGWDVSKSGKIDEERLRKGLETALPRPSTRARPADTTLEPRTRPPERELKTVTSSQASSATASKEPAESPTAPVATAEPAPQAASTSSGEQGYDAFKAILDRNIFNTTRRPGRSARDGDEPKPKQVDTVSLVGTITYDKGPYAFFDGTRSEYKKVLQPGETIAGYTLQNVDGNVVTLQAGTNTVTLHVGMQMNREEDGPWQVVDSWRANPTLSRTSGASSSGSDAGDDDVVKRLMQQREQELK